jgi:glycerate 2-kinase
VALRMAANEDGFAAYEDDIVAVVGDNAAAVNAIVTAAEEEGVPVRVAWPAKEGEARVLASEWVAACLGCDRNMNLLLGGGEATVAVRGEGIGGRNTEFTLAAALELERLGNRDWIIASLATDGQDGPTGAAGAIATPSTVDRARSAGLDPASCLDRNDSFRLFERVGGAAITGPTGTNVNDIYVALRIG